MKTQIDRFIISATLGATDAGSATAYLAEEVLLEKLRRPVVLEILPPAEARDQRAPERIQTRFARLLALPSHPHVVALLSLGITDENPWAAFEYLPTCLSELITDNPTPSGEVTRMLLQIGSALDFLHTRVTEETKATPAGRGLLHHNLHPDSIFRNEQGDYKLGGLMLLAPPGAEPTCPLHMVRYAAPELLQRELGPVGPATDLYALGHLACLLALGKKLARAQFPQVYENLRSNQEGPPAKWMQWHCSLPTAAPDLPKLLPQFPEGLANLITRLMVKNPAERLTSAAELLTGLAELSPTSNPAPSASVSPTTQSPMQKVASAITTQPNTPTANTSASPTYFVRMRGNMTGPFDLPTLQRQARQGLLSRLHQVSNDQINWRSATTVEGLFGK